MIYIIELYYRIMLSINYLILGNPTKLAPIPNPAPERALTAMEGI